jgi:anti-sigma factor RsiW
VTHSEIRARLSEYLERDLDPAERSRVEGHLDGCGSCSRELHELRETVSLLRRLPEPGHPPALADAVMTRIASEASGPARVRSLFARLGDVVAEPRVALALAASLAGVFLMVQPAAPPPAVVAVYPSIQQPRWVIEGNAGLPAAAVISSATPAEIYASYARRARETARQLRGAGHPYSESLAAHLEARPNVALADWQPR